MSVPPFGSGSNTPTGDNLLQPQHASGSHKSEANDSVLDKPREGQVRRGVCKFFNSQKGFGFVLDNNAEELGGQEVFVHFTAIQSKTGFRSLGEGEEVEYEITTGPKGFQASRLTGPGGRPVMGDPKARMLKQQPQFMQLAPIAFPNPYGMDPYPMQQHPGALYSPYNVVYVPQIQTGQAAQYAQVMQASPGQGPSFGSPNFSGLPQFQHNTSAGVSGRSAALGMMGSLGGSGGPPAQSGFGLQQQSSAFGPVGGLNFGPQPPQAQQRFLQSQGQAPGLANGDFTPIENNPPGSQADAFFGSGNLLYSSQ